MRRILRWKERTEETKQKRHLLKVTTRGQMGNNNRNERGKSEESGNVHFQQKEASLKEALTVPLLGNEGMVFRRQ